MSSKSSDKPKAKWLTRQKFFSVSAIILWVALAYIIANALAYVSLLAASRLGWVDTSQQTLITIVSGLITYAVSLFLLFLGIRLARKYPKKLSLLEIKKSDWAVGGWLTWQQLLLGVAAFIAAMILMVVVLALIGQIVPGFNIEQAQEIGVDPRAIYNRTEMLAVFALFVIIAPISEELIFRGYLYGKLRQMTSIVTSVIITSLLFGLAHLQPNVAVATFVMSVVMCLCREATQSIYPAIIVHILKNGIAFALLFIMQVN